MHTLTTLVAAGCAALALPATPSAAALPPAPAAAAQDPAAEFRTKFNQALEINAKEEIAKLVRTYTEPAIDHAIELCKSIAAGGGEHAEKQMAALQAAWRTSYKSGFLEKVYKFYSLLDPRAAKRLDEIDRQYAATFTKWHENRTKKDQAVFDLLAGQFESAAKGYEELGHYYFAARSWILAGNCLDVELRAGAADLHRAADIYAACVRCCEAVEFNAVWAVTVKQRFDTLTREGKGAAAGNASGEGPKDPNAPAQPAGAAPVKGAAAVVAPLKFEPVPSFDTWLRPSYFADDVAILWPNVFMGEKGSSGTFPALDSKQVKMLRTGAAALALDVDGDGKADADVPSSGNRAVLRFSIGEGEAKREWAVVTEVGTDKETYQGISVNFQPNDRQFQLYIMSAASVVGTIGEVPVRIFDDSMDGIYGSPAKQWGYPGLPEGAVQSDIDSIVVGAEKKARPWSQYVEVGGTWYELENQNGGVGLKATPATLETGKLKLDYKGEMPEYVILQGEGPYANTFVDLLQNGGAEVAAPAGKYKLFFGIVRKGKKQQMMKALILPGKRTPTFAVEPGKTTTIALGAPFGFEFEQEVKDGKLTVQGKSVTVIGAQHERYERLWNCVPRPELVWRKAGTKKGSKPERLGIVEDLNAVDEQGKALHEYADTYHPLDLSVEVKLKEGEVAEAQLVEKKNKLFGPIESAWMQ